MEKPRVYVNVLNNPVAWCLSLLEIFTMHISKVWRATQGQNIQGVHGLRFKYLGSLLQPQCFMFCLELCCSWYSLESSQGRGPRMFFQVSRFNSLTFCRKNTSNKRRGSNVSIEYITYKPANSKPENCYCVKNKPEVSFGILFQRPSWITARCKTVFTVLQTWGWKGLSND